MGDPALPDRPRRRHFHADYKLTILADYDRMTGSCQKGAFLPARRQLVDLIEMHKRTIDLIVEVLDTCDGWMSAFNPLEFMRAMRDFSKGRGGFRRARSNLFGTICQFYDPTPDAVAVNVRAFGLPPEGDSFGERAIRSWNVPKFIADELYDEAPITPGELDLLERIHTQYVTDTGRLDFAKRLAGFVGAILLIGKLVPKEALDVLGVLQWYGWYQLVVSAMAICLVFYVGVAWLINFWSLGQRRDVSELFAVVLLRLRQRALG